MTATQNIASLSPDEKRRLLSEVLRRKQGEAQPVWPRYSDGRSGGRALKFGLMFFGGDDGLGAAKYRLLLESAKFADAHGFSGIWLPERHFTKFGCLYPNPAVLHAALARETKNIRLRAGSVVMPLQNPIRVAEEWAVVDVLSGGRVDLSFASGWHPDDFALAPEKYTDRKGEMLRGIQAVRKLWRGETVSATSGNGQQIEVRTYPTPLQQKLNVWLTAAGNPETFEKAGEIDAGVVTHLFDQGIDDLAEKIEVYRDSRSRHGFDPGAGNVTVTLHTFLGETLDEVRRHAGGPYRQFLKENLGLLKNLAFSRGMKIDVSSLTSAELDELLSAVFEKFLGGRSLLGTPDTCFEMARQLAEAGVDEVACLLDFGPAEDAILQMLPQLAELQERCFAARQETKNAPAAR
jgi:natural product biosynthesis luciferase-like monooxygenase protein